MLALSCERCRGAGGGELSSLPVDDGIGVAVAAVAEVLRLRLLLSLSLRGDRQEISAGVWRRVDLVAGAALVKTEEKDRGETMAGDWTEKPGEVKRGLSR